MKRVCVKIAILVSFVTLPSPDRSARASESGSIEPDEIVLVSTRHLSGGIGCTVSTSQLCSSVVDGCGRLQRIDSGAAVSGGPGVVCIFVHGNRIPANEVATRGLSVYRALKRASNCSGPMRFVIWSWPSERVHGLLRDGRVKFARTDPEAYYLASFLSSLPQDQQLSLLGFSLGARIITGALHLSAGGTLHGQMLRTESASAPRARVALMAAAVENNWLLPECPHGHAMRKIESLLLLNNSRDRALRMFHAVSSAKGRPQALGHTGLMCACQLGTDRRRIQQYDYSNMLGRDHSLAGYTESRTIAARLATHLLP